MKYKSQQNLSSKTNTKKKKFHYNSLDYPKIYIYIMALILFGFWLWGLCQLLQEGPLYFFP